MSRLISRDPFGRTELHRRQDTGFTVDRTNEAESFGERLCQSDMLTCPHAIMVFGHYRPGGSCRCNDPGHREMAEWGYTWDAEKGRWV
jgi:hypothetical protein